MRHSDRFKHHTGRGDQFDILRKPPVVLMVTNTSEGQQYGLETGKAITAKTAREIQADLFVKPNDDGLFPDCPQTWKREG